MINVDINQDDSPQDVLNKQRILANAMRTLIETDGWRYMQVHLDRDIAKAYSDMMAAVTGDVSLKASASYTCMKNLRDLPEKSLTSSLQSIRALEEEVNVPAPVHHRSAQLPKKK